MIGFVPQDGILLEFMTPREPYQSIRGIIYDDKKCGIEALTVTLSTFQTQKLVFYREYAGRRNWISSFFYSYSVASLKSELVNTLGYYSLTYYILKFNPPFTHFLCALGIGTLTSLCESGYGYLFLRN